MHSSYVSFALLTSILLLTATVRPHPQVPLPSSGEPPAAFMLQDTEDVGFGSVEGNLISQCDQSSNSFKSRRLRNRNPGQKLPSSCLANPTERNSQSEQEIEPDKEQSGAGNRELNEGKNDPLDLPTIDLPTMGSSTTSTANPELCPTERLYPVCADDKAIIAMPQSTEHYFPYLTYMLHPAYAYNPFYRCAFPEILWCCFGFAHVKIRDSTERNPPLLGLSCRPQDPTHLIDPATVRPKFE